MLSLFFKFVSTGEAREVCFPEGEENLCRSSLFSFLGLEFFSLLNLLKAPSSRKPSWTGFTLL